jgi:predicted dehydrogenase
LNSARKVSKQQIMSSQQLKKRTRREFVKTSTLAAGGLLVMPSVLAAKAHVDGSDAIKIALIGCGGRGTGAALQALLTKQNVKLVAMADAFKDRLDKCYQTLTSKDVSDWTGTEGNVISKVSVPEEHKFVGFDAYKKAIPLADVVIDCCPPGFRPAHFEEAIRQGKHVFMEKPVAVDAPGIRKVLEAAELAKAKKLNVVVGLQRRYDVGYQKWVELIHNGKIGDIVTSYVYWNGDGVWVNPRKPGQTEMEYQMKNWYYFNWLCGDHIVEQHIHNLDVGNWVKRNHPVKAQGMGGRQVRVGPDFGEIFDHHFVEFEYADGSRMISQCRHQKGTMSKVTESFHGTKGYAPEPGTLVSNKGKVLFKYNWKNNPNPYQVEHDRLFEAISKGEWKYADAETGALATMTAILGRMATYSGKEIKWEDAIKSDINLSPQELSWNANPKSLPDASGMYACAVPGVTRVV